MLLIGSTFITVSGIMYFLFIMAMILVGSWFLSEYGRAFLYVLGFILVLAGSINLKDFLFFGKGVSLTISNEEKSRIMKKSAKIVRIVEKSDENKKMLLIGMGATAVLAVFVNMVELGCTAILPTVYMASLIGRFGTNVNLSHIIWTIFYSIVYVVPLFIIMMGFVYSFKSTRLTEKQGRILKLVAGLFMLFFGIIMLLRPDLLLVVK